MELALLEKKLHTNKTFSLANSSINQQEIVYTVDSTYLQVVFVRENIAIKWPARLPKAPFRPEV